LPVKKFLLRHLSSYSSELNPVELLWREMRRKYFHNKIFHSLDEVGDTLPIALNRYHRNNNAIKQLGVAYKYFNNNDSG